MGCSNAIEKIAKNITKLFTSINFWKIMIAVIGVLFAWSLYGLVMQAAKDMLASIGIGGTYTPYIMIATVTGLILILSGKKISKILK